MHTKTSSLTNEKAVVGVTDGLLEKGDTVTWVATDFCIRQSLPVKTVDMERPNHFTDNMVKRAFQSYICTHVFLELSKGILMISTFYYNSPFDILVILADKLFSEKNSSLPHWWKIRKNGKNRLISKPFPL